ncbi:ATP-binding protein [Streptomyces sp. SID14478]|uniref:ATP-binding protein n=1 Tax=Streptomyces sp. SID14478 TaxID=2706073 RepID=UPI0013DE8A82|nr:ATP-binding protein [Streptomyces sp. SID14478]NEB80799.1 ATP-binding protein [Streptomyces sp. SID14478]
MTEYLDGTVIPIGFDTPVEPLRRMTHYTGEPGCIAQARTFAATFLAQLTQEWCVAVDRRAEGDVLLVVSELVTNADRHSTGPYALELEGTTDQIVVTVYDSSGKVPKRYPKDPSRVGGHGLEIVSALAEVTVERVPVGKRVRAVVTLSA